MASQAAQRLSACLLATIFFAGAQAATLTVNTVADPSLGGACTLRDAINSINGGADSGGCVASGAYGSSGTINFNISGAGVKTIALASSLPAISKPMPVLTDGGGHATFNVTFSLNASVITSRATSFIGGVFVDT